MNKQITTGLLIGSTLVTLANCRCTPLHLFKNIFHPIISLVNTFINSNNSDISGLELIKTDTVNVTSRVLEDPDLFLKELKKHGIATSGKVIIGSKIKYDYGMNFNGKMGMGWHIKCEYAPKYLPESIKINVKNEVLATKDEEMFFITVDFYGKRNPKISAKHIEA